MKMLQSLKDATEPGLYFCQEDSSLAVVNLTDRLKAWAAVPDGNGGWKKGDALRTIDYANHWCKIDLPSTVQVERPPVPKPPALDPKFIPATEGSFLIYNQPVMIVKRGTIKIASGICGEIVLNTSDQELDAFITLLREARDLVRRANSDALQKNKLMETLVDEEDEEQEEEEEDDET